MINDLNKHKKSDTIKWIIVFTCIILLTAGLLVTVTNGFTDFGAFGTTQQEESTNTETPAPTPEQAPVTPSEAEVINTIQVVNSDLMMLSVGAPIATMDETEVVNSRATSGVGVIATVLPEGTDSTLTWEICFFDTKDPDVIGKNASDYVELIFNNEEKTDLTVIAKQAFDAKIRIVATSVANPDVSACLIVDYEMRLADEQTLMQRVGDFFVSTPTTGTINYVNGIVTDTASDMASYYGECIAFGNVFGIGTMAPERASYSIYVEASDDFIAVMQQMGIASKCADYVYLGDEMAGVTTGLILNTLVGADIIPEADGTVNTAQITKFNKAALALGEDNVAFTIKIEAYDHFGVHTYLYDFCFNLDSMADLIVTGIQFNIGNIVL